MTTTPKPAPSNGERAKLIMGFAQVAVAATLSTVVIWVGWSVRQLDGQSRLRTDTVMGMVRSIDQASQLRSDTLAKMVDSLDRRLTVIEQNGAAVVRERLAGVEVLVKQNQQILMELRDRRE